MTVLIAVFVLMAVMTVSSAIPIKNELARLQDTVGENNSVQRLLQQTEESKRAKEQLVPQVLLGLALLLYAESAY